MEENHEVAGRFDLEEGKPDPEPMIPSSSTESSLLAFGPYAPSFMRPCDGFGSCWYASNWRDRQPSVGGDWEEEVVVKYFFELDIDQTRKEAFRAATAVYQRQTCIRFVEVDSNYSESGRIRVGRFHSTSCYTDLPQPFGITKFNLGSCMNMNHLGEILHQLGHALGMLDEQRRPDATRTYHLHGPHLQVFWQNIPTNWKVVFQPNEAAYTGSLNDGVGDAFDGYAPYDFESIMHISPWLYGMQVCGRILFQDPKS